MLQNPELALFGATSGRKECKIHTRFEIELVDRVSYAPDFDLLFPRIYTYSHRILEAAVP
jgi:hypothetical protein